MIGVVVVTHGDIGKEMIAATLRIIPDAKHLRSVAVTLDMPPEEITSQIRNAISSLHGVLGVLLLTDMFGGTPSNICLTFLDEPNLEVISGVNLPMLIKLASAESKMSFGEMILFIQRYGQKNIVVGRGILRGELEQK